MVHEGIDRGCGHSRVIQEERPQGTDLVEQNSQRNAEQLEKFPGHRCKRGGRFAAVRLISVESLLAT